MQKVKLTDEEYRLLKECLKWNLYFYKEKISQTKNSSNNILGGFDCQREQIKKMEDLNGKI